MPKLLVLFVDDELLILRALERVLQRRSHLYELLFAASAADALLALAAQPIDVVVADYRMPEMSGDRFLHAVKELYPAAVRVMTTGEIDTNEIDLTAVQHLLTKPFASLDLTLLLDAVSDAKERDL